MGWKTIILLFMCMKGKGVQRFILKAAREVSTTTASDFSVEQILQVISGSSEHR